MAKRRGRKSDAIRAVLAERPAASVKEIQAALTAKRVKASVALISKLKSGQRPAVNGQASMDQLLAAKSFVARVGSVDAARRSLESLATLLGPYRQCPAVCPHKNRCIRELGHEHDHLAEGGCSCQW